MDRLPLPLLLLLLMLHGWLVSSTFATAGPRGMHRSDRAIVYSVHYAVEHDTGIVM
jgi:hypothetical protein